MIYTKMMYTKMMYTLCTPRTGVYNHYFAWW